MAEIVMPRLSDTMEEGTILRWLKREGEQVERGEELVEIETDKAAMVYESDEQGVLHILAGEGDTLPVGATIARVGQAEDVELRSQQSPSTPATQPPPASATQPAPATQPPPGVQPGAATGRPPDASGETPTPAAQAAAPPDADEGRVKASPLAKRIARERGIELRGLRGSGPGGRIVKADVEASAGGVASPAAAPAPAKSPSSGGAAESASSTAAGESANVAAGESPSAAAETLGERVATAKGETRTVELTRVQQTIARRMAESKATIPDFSLQMEIEMEACVALRAELKRLSPEEAPTYNDMIVKACALALREHPRANGSYRDGKLQLHSRVNVGIAVAERRRARGPDGLRRRPEVARRDRPRDARAGRAGARRHDHAARAGRRHLHGLEPRDVRGAELHRDRQPAAGRDPVGRLARAARGRADPTRRSASREPARSARATR